MKTNFFKTGAKMITKFLGVLLIGILFFSSCRGDDGAQGEQGPMGNANVQLLTVENPTWIGHDIFFDNAAITQDVLDNAAVLTYMVFNIYPDLVYHVPGIGPDAAFQIRVYDEVGTVRFNIRNVNGSSFTGTLPGVNKIKVIIIPAGTAGTSAKMSASSVEMELKNAGVDINDYEAVKKYYNIVE